MSILEVPNHEARPQEWRSDFARALQQQRERAIQVFQVRREKFAALQTELSLRLAELAEELARQQAEALERGITLGSEQVALETRQAEFQLRGDELKTQHEQWVESLRNGQRGQQELLAQLQERLAEMELRHGEMENARCELQTQQAECARRAAAHAETQAELDLQQTNLDEHSRELSRRQSELAEERAELDNQRKILKKREQAAQRQRRTIARQLRTRKAELVAETESLRREACAVPGQDLELHLRCSELQGKCDRLREEAAEFSQLREEWQERLSAIQLQLAERQGEWNQAQKQADETQSRLKKLESEQREVLDERDQLRSEKERLDAVLTQLRADVSTASASAQGQISTEQETGAELRRLRDENKQLEEWLTEAEAAAEAARSAADDAATKLAGLPDNTQELTDLRRRLEMATVDCRDLKSKNAELQDQLARAQASSAKPPAAASSVGMDWETQKQRLLAKLEADHDEADPEQKANRLTIEEAMQVTDEVMADKDRELRNVRREVEELRSLLENQSSSIGQFAVGAAAFAGMLDKDELVRHERENLQKMQESLREQLKKAEIDISMERAKIARDRAELEEQLHSWKCEQAQQAAADPSSGGDKGKQPRGRWLSRLGLSDGK